MIFFSTSCICPPSNIQRGKVFELIFLSICDFSFLIKGVTDGDLFTSNKQIPLGLFMPFITERKFDIIEGVLILCIVRCMTGCYRFLLPFFSDEKKQKNIRLFFLSNTNTE